MAKDAREGSIQTGMWLASEQPVSARDVQGMLENCLHVAFVGHKQDHRDVQVFFDQQVAHRVDQRLVEGFGDLQQVLPLQVPVHFRSDTRNADVRDGDGRCASRGDLCRDPLPYAGISEPVDHRVGAALLQPFGQNREQHRTPGGVWILVERHLESALAGLFDLSQELPRPPELRPPGDLEMRDVQRSAATLGDSKHLVEGLEHSGVLVAHVDDDEAAVVDQLGAQGSQFVLVGVRARRIDETGRESNGADLQALAQKGDHLLQFGGRSPSILHSHGPKTQISMRYQTGQVRPRRRCIEGREILLEGRPRPLQVGIAEQSREMPAPVGLVLGSDGRGGDAILAEKLGRDALHQFRCDRRILENHEIGVAMCVDEAGRDGRVGAIDLDCRSSAPERTQRGDRVALDSEIGLEPGASGSIENPRVLEQQVKSDVLGHEDDSLLPLPLL